MPVPGHDNGRPWFVFYDPAAVGIAHFGTFMVPFQPSNEFEELTLQSTPWNYREFPTKTAALAWVNSPEGKKIKSAMGKTPGGLGNNRIVDPLTGLNAIGDFFNRLTDSHTWVRVGEVVAGGMLLYLGLKAVVTPAGQNVGRQTVKSTASQIASGAKKAAELVAAAG